MRGKGDDPRGLLTDGESIIVGTGARIEFTCCDCGLVHSIWPSYDAVSRFVALMLVRDEDRTRVARRKMRRKKEGVFK